MTAQRMQLKLSRNATHEYGRGRFRDATKRQYLFQNAPFTDVPRCVAPSAQAAGCPASPSSSETRCLSASRLPIVVIDPMCKRSSTETNCVSPIDSASDCTLRIPRDARSIASATRGLISVNSTRTPRFAIRRISPSRQSPMGSFPFERRLRTPPPPASPSSGYGCNDEASDDRRARRSP